MKASFVNIYIYSSEIPFFTVVVLLVIILAMRRWYIFVMMSGRLTISLYFYYIPLSCIYMMRRTSYKCPSDISDKEKEGQNKMRDTREFHFREYCMDFRDLFNSISKHHTSKEMFYDMTVCHPRSRITHIYKNIYILIFGNKNGIFPDKIPIRCSILVQY